MKLKINDSVRVKQGVLDPDFNVDISGWQGRISEICDEKMICIDWDSETLKLIPESQIKQCEREGMGWNQMNLGLSDCESVSPRDTLEQTKEMLNIIQNKYAWAHLGEQGDRIQSILSDASPDDEMAMLTAWKSLFETALVFPFKAKVCEFQEGGPLQCGDVVRVHEMTDSIDELRGIYTHIEFKKNHYYFPLSDLEAIDKNTKNFTPVRDYVVWFANR